ncbi:MAG TPA: hypothetical protein VFZ70_16980 [Euzebyales bacterium]
MTTTCGVTPHAQKTGTSPSATRAGFAEVRLLELGDADLGGIAHVDRCTVRLSVAPGDLDREVDGVAARAAC